VVAGDHSLYRADGYDDGPADGNLPGKGRHDQPRGVHGNSLGALGALGHHGAPNPFAAPMATPTTVVPYTTKSMVMVTLPEGILSVVPE